MPTKNVSITLTDADGLASFTDAAMLVLYLSREEVESATGALAPLGFSCRCFAA